MSHTYISDFVHCVFSTKLRRNLISSEIQPELWAFIGGIARKNGFKALMVDGAENHVHILLSLPATMPVAKAVQLMKGASSRWMNEKHGCDFAWQEGYGAFTVGISQKNRTIAYIQSQAEHHRKRSFEEEFLAFLKRHGVEYDPQLCVGIGRGNGSSVPPGRRAISIQATRRWKRRAIARGPSGTAHASREPAHVPEGPPKIARQFHWRESATTNHPCPVGIPEPVAGCRVRNRTPTARTAEGDCPQMITPVQTKKPRSRRAGPLIQARS